MLVECGEWTLRPVRSQPLFLMVPVMERSTSLMNLILHPMADCITSLPITYGDLGPLQRAPFELELIRSAPDGVTERTVLGNENFRLMNEALWAPDAGFVIVAFAPAEDVRYGGQAEIAYFDGRPYVVLTSFAQEMKWGP